MPEDLRALVRCKSPDDCLALTELLDSSTRPDFEEDIAEDRQATFRAVVQIEYPETIQREDAQFLATWSECHLQLAELDASLRRAGAEVLSAFLIDDWADYETDEDGDDVLEHSFFLRQAGQLKRVTQRSLRTAFPGQSLPNLKDDEPDDVLRALAALAAGKR